MFFKQHGHPRVPEASSQGWAQQQYQEVRLTTGAHSCPGTWNQAAQQALGDSVGAEAHLKGRPAGHRLAAHYQSGMQTSSMKTPPAQLLASAVSHLAGTSNTNGSNCSHHTPAIHNWSSRQGACEHRITLTWHLPCCTILRQVD
jgi:hypothetical protein